MEAYFSGGNTMPGAQLATTIRNMAALGRIGQQVLEAHGIHEIDPNQRYSFRIRRSIHAIVLKRFGPEALYSFGFAYGDYWSHIHDAAGALRTRYLSEGRERLRQPDALAEILDCCFRMMREILERNSVGDIRYGATIDVADAVAGADSDGLRFRATMTNTSTPDQEAFPRGLFENFLYMYLSDCWRFSSTFRPEETTHGEEWTQFVWSLAFEPIHADEDAKELAWEQRLAAREALLGQVLAESDNRNRLVMESMNYARLLQQAQLPRANRYPSQVKQLGVLWEPRDTIGGDLWWMTPADDSGRFTLFVVDCAGHGVPGAMLALLASTTLERLHASDPSMSPSLALQALGNALRRGLNQDQDLHDGESPHDDGCDAAALQVDVQAGKATFAGANLGLICLPAGAPAIRLRGDAVRLGYRDAADALPAEQVIAFSPGDRFVLNTDGITDQVGRGDDARTMAFGFRRLMTALDEYRSLPAQALMEVVGDTVRRWQGEGLRRDDVTAICIEL
ncbi:MAG: hypothetical protein RL404_1094 [Pseudomonadota bacterium]